MGFQTVFRKEDCSWVLLWCTDIHMSNGDKDPDKASWEWVVFMSMKEIQISIPHISVF